MATFPHSLCGIRQDGHGEQHMPMVLRSDMERGIPKQRRAGADVLVRVPCSLVFRSAADAAAFESWFYAEGMGWFNFTLPRTGAVVQARIIGGDIGTLSPLTPAWNASERSVVLEYVRPAFVTLAPGLYDVDSSRILSVQRNSTATYIDSSGVLQTAAANTARYQGGQVLVEGESTNRLLQSQTLNGLAWNGCTVSSTADVYRGMAPFWLVSKALPSGSEAFGQFLGSAISGDVGTLTAALLAGSVDQCSLGIYLGSGWGGDQESTGVVVEGPGVISAPSGSLCTITGLSVTVPTLVRITRTFTEAGGVSVFLYPGVHTSTTVGHSVKMTRTQYEAGAAATSYIPTTTAPVTRAADIITVAA